MSGSKVESLNCSKEFPLDIPVQILLPLSTLCCVSGKIKLANNSHERNSRILHSLLSVAILEAKITPTNLPEIKGKTMNQLNRLYGSVVLEHCKHLFLWNRTEVFPFWRGQELTNSFPGMNGQLPPWCLFYADPLIHLCAQLTSSNKAKINPPKSHFHIKVLKSCQ